METNKPILMIDVDGPLNPWAAKPHRRPEGYSTHRMNPLDQNGVPWVRMYRKPLRVWLKKEHGPQLLKLGEVFELVWASTWGPEANAWIGPVLGLPDLEYVDFWVEDKDPGRNERINGVYWKTPQLITHANGRPFAWVDDEITDLDREYAAGHHAGPALLHHVDPRKGLLDKDFRDLAAWATGLAV